MTITEPKITGIGSLPHHNVDAALEFSFQHDIPFLPQIPVRNPWESMIAQALEGLPGLEARAQTAGGAAVELDLELWASRASEFNHRLCEAIEGGAYEAFEPSAATCSGWSPFLWELEERRAQIAKIQISGPLTAQWALRLKDGSPAARHPELQSQIYRLVLCRAVAMVRRLKRIGVQPLIFLDEPGLYGYSAADPKHVLGLQELKVLVATLGKEGAAVGLHCCSNTDWSAVFSLELDSVSIDTLLSLEPLFSEAHAPALRAHIARGGRLSLGVIPTADRAVLHSLANGGGAELADLIFEQARALGQPAALLREALYTPACGLALHSIADAELVLEQLLAFRDQMRRRLRPEE